jgi:hypothetical protein
MFMFAVPRENRLMKSNTTTIVPCLLASIAGLVTLNGCDQRSESAKTVQAAADNLHSVGVYPATGTDKFESRLKEVAASVSSVASNGSSAEKAAAALVTSTTLRGQGEVAAGNAKDIELDIRNRMQYVAARLADYASLSSSAAALRTFDPSKDISELNDAKSVRETELADLTAKLAQARAKVEQFSSQAQQRLAASETAATQYAQLMGTTTGMSATQAVDVVTKANVFRRQADSLRTEAGKLQAQADLAKPVADELTLLESKAKNQIANFESTVVALNTRKSESQAQADSLTSAATLAANDADKVITEIVALRSSELIPAYDAAMAALTKAVSQANAGNDASVAGARIAKASAQMAVAETHWARASGAEVTAMSLERLAAAQPSLPGKSEYEKQALAAREEAKTARAAIEAALLDAQGTFESVKVTDTATRERLTQLAAQVAKLKDIASGAQIVPPQVAEPESAASGDAASSGAPDASTGAGAGVDPAIAETVLSSLTNVRDGKFDGLLSGLHSDGPKTKPILESLVAADTAVKTKFNKSLMQLLQASPDFAPMSAQLTAAMATPQLANLKAQDLTVTMIADDKASVAIPGQPMPSMLVKRDGVWKQDLSMLDMLMGGLPKPFGDAIGKIPGLMNTWATSVTSGTYADEAAALEGLKTTFAPLMAEMGPGAMPPGGG